MIRKLFNKVFLFTFYTKRLLLLHKKKYLYQSIKDSNEIYNYQINKFNEMWSRAISTVPYYRKMQKIHNLPDKISSIEQLQKFPVLTKDAINENQKFILENLKKYYLTSSGGTSGVTTHFPTSKDDSDEAYVNAYLGRSWWGINPLDRILMFWGHSHLFGKGIKSKVKHFKRVLFNFLINTKRISCYSLNFKNIEYFFRMICKVRPKVIISYSSNIFKICKYMESKGIKHYDSKFESIILTSESVTQADIELINSRFNVNIINEYGMAETGAIAYSYEKTDNIRVFWDSFIVTQNKNGKIFITSIGNKIFPLVNYDTEDIAMSKVTYKQTVLFISSINGKERNVLKIPRVSGGYIDVSTILFDHVLKYYPDIYSIHYSQNKNEINIYLTSNISLNINKINNYFQKKVKKEFNDICLDAINISQIFEDMKTIAGKNKTLI